MRILLVVFLFLLFSCGNSVSDKEAAKEIKVFAAASLTNVLSELVDTFSVQHNAKVVTNLASSGTLARQIAQGELPHVYLSASKKWAAYVDSLGFVKASLKKVFTQNELVLVAPADSKFEAFKIDSATDIRVLLQEERLSIGDPSHVPAGQYAKSALEYFGWYDEIQHKILPAKDVRSALRVVELGETPLGIVFSTDAKKSEKVKVLATLPPQSHKPIAYVASVCKDDSLSRVFYDFLSSKKAKEILVKHGFKP